MKPSIATSGTTSARGGTLYTHLRGARKQRRKRYGRYDSRGRLAGKRPITDRPCCRRAPHPCRPLGNRHVARRQPNRPVCAEPCRSQNRLPPTSASCAARTTRARQPLATPCTSFAANRVRCTPSPPTMAPSFITTLHIERATGTRFYFAHPHHSWERGTNENTNGLLRQYLPKRHSMAHLTQHDCNALARKLNRRPRKRLGFQTPEECYEQ